MPLTNIISLVSYILSALIFASIFWAHVDALNIRIEVKTLLKTTGFALLTIAAFIIPAEKGLIFPYSGFTLYLAGIALWLILISIVLDTHSKLQFLTIAAVIFTIFLRNYLLLTALASLIAVTTLRLAHNQKHNDFIPLGVGFVLLATAYLFYYLADFQTYRNFQLAGAVLHLVASITLFYWLWQYLVIRYNLKRKTHKLPLKTRADQNQQDKEKIKG